ncbi:acetolactate synthase small subunit [Firmicutes bacterium CAG:882]|mgnify:FL=1|jgi:acetolactate synthase-1/3 small subunit|nr:acetolactate synthase small subunit [Firmicutes bacterium CAG:882]
MKQRVFSLLVENEAGVLSRIAGLFSRRGYNIDSLTVGVTENPSLSRMTVAASGEEDVLDQIEKQLSKLIDVKSIEVLPDGVSVCRELILCRVKCNAQERSQVITVAEVFRAKIVDVAPESVMIELTGNEAKLTAFLGLLDGYEILDLARTGLTGLKRGVIA